MTKKNQLCGNITGQISGRDENNFCKLNINSTRQTNLDIIAIPSNNGVLHLLTKLLSLSKWNDKNLHQTTKDSNTGNPTTITRDEDYHYYITDDNHAG